MFRTPWYVMEKKCAITNINQNTDINLSRFVMYAFVNNGYVKIVSITRQK
ncbi:MAG: hypothetical protein A07HN63_00726 [uncultured archaeon A07HN63]|nr:MAG: hypothetical protein A07HN63_00726 [uncultured archaeon A07HN63]